MYVSELGQSGEEGSDLFYCSGFERVKNLLHGSSGDPDERRGEDGNSFEPPSCTSARTGRVMEDLEGGLILCLCSMYDQPLSHTHKRAQGGLQLMNPQVFPPLSRCGALGYL